MAELIIIMAPFAIMLLCLAALSVMFDIALRIKPIRDLWEHFIESLLMEH